MIRRGIHCSDRPDLDLVVIGGGIHGACVLLEAARRGLRAHLVERDDFGGATSWNSLRILHGGLRYLQALDLQRFRESVGERRWFCRHFPDLVQPLECLMPLYDRGLKRRSVVRIALALNDWLSRDRNQHVAAECSLPNGRLVSTSDTVQMFPGVNRTGLRGGAVWYDATTTSTQRLLIEILRWACAAGGMASNYVTATRLDLDDHRVVGISAHDRISDRPVSLRARTVINCAGPWSRVLAAEFDRDVPDLGRPSLAFNVLVNREPLSDAALAVQEPRHDGPLYIIRPYLGRVLAGTLHAPWRDTPTYPRPDRATIRALLDGLNRAAPGLDLAEQDVVRVYAGLLPGVATGSDEPTKRPFVYDHGRHGGPRGLVSVCGIKYTTARAVAQRALGAADPTWLARGYEPATARPRPAVPFDAYDPRVLDRLAVSPLRELVSRLVDEESVYTWDDLLHRRTDWGHDPVRAPALRRRVADVLGENALLDDIESSPTIATRQPEPRTHSAVIGPLP